ncbi:actin-related protein 5 [Scyliorhinus canicula]|uniref:actin-related protein 5 n=1 Tax=Scyliorhinus canicula TaxID=7830 RepID=UPI0018F738E2|nr:actin-related protein 5 [Scyliorhinus canicula]
MAAATGADFATETPPNVYYFRDPKPVPDPIFELGEAHRDSPGGVPLVVDNGSFQCRVGWALDQAPRLQFKNVSARSRGASRSDTQIGNDIRNLEVVRWLLKSQFDRNVVVNFDIQEQVFDYIFQHLGIASEFCIEHPVVLTEAPCNPLYSRQLMSELLFECYHVPKVSYGIDDLYSFWRNNRSASSGLIVSSGYHCCHVLPVLHGRLEAHNGKRINLGGSQAASYMQRLLQLKYPGHLPAITLSRMEEILHERCYIAADYMEELDLWKLPDFYTKNIHRMQLPFNNKLLASTLTAEERMERRQQQIRRLQELNARRREEKLQLDQERLERLLSIQELLEEGMTERFKRALLEMNMDSAEELQSYINKLSLVIEQTKQKILQAEVNVEVDVVDTKPDVSDLDQVLSCDQSMDELEGVNELDQLFPEYQSDFDKQTNVVQPIGQMFNLAEYHQLHLGSERIRVPEILFQPSLIGEEQAGIAETLQYVLDRYSKEQQDELVQNVFLTGGNILYPGMKTRMERELLAMRPFQSSFQVSMAANPVLDSWFGARDWAVEYKDQAEGWITLADYEEKGGEYLSEHAASNVHVPMCLAKPT